MKAGKIKCLFLLPLLFLLSCNIEKRLYSGGYYISSARTIKNKAPERNPPAVLSEPVAEAAPVLQEPANEAPALFLEPVRTERATVQTDAVQPEVDKRTVRQKLLSEKKDRIVHPSPEDDKTVQGDVRKLLFSSLGALAASVIFTFASASGIAFLSNVLFILIPFSIIGIWIFALMLYSKYSYEDPERTESRSGNKKIYSKHKAFLLAGFLGIFGAHRFYLGYTDTGLFEMFTLGGFFVLYFIDMLMIKYGKLKPKNGDYGIEDPKYKRSRKKLAPNRSQLFIKIALAISLVALLTMLGSVLLL